MTYFLGNKIAAKQSITEEEINQEEDICRKYEILNAMFKAGYWFDKPLQVFIVRY